MQPVEKYQINVCVRFKPLGFRERNAVKLRRQSENSSQGTVVVGEKLFSFDSVFEADASQEKVYQTCIKPLVDGFFQGYNATVFAYGQTGSGKTHSIMGSNALLDINPVDPQQGAIPRAVDQIFSTLNNLCITNSFNETIVIDRLSTVRVSMLEIYNDECRDLLHPEIPTTDIALREDKDGKMFFTGAREEVVTGTNAALRFLEMGNTNRSTAETLMNQSSSRSHAIFTISMELLDYKENIPSNANSNFENRSYIQAKLHLVDLAGSERAKKTGAVGVRFKESVGINQGLLSLGKVIRALTAVPASTHIPYRESKLTRFLQDSLGGNSRTVMLACISTAESNLHETLSTLQYASRTKAVQNKVTANISVGSNIDSMLLQNVDLESTVVHALKEQIRQLQQGMHQTDRIPSELAASQSVLANDANSEKWKAVNHDLERMLQVLNFTSRALKSTLSKLFDVNGHSKDETHNDKLRRKCEELVQVLEDFLARYAQRGVQNRSSYNIRHARNSNSFADSISSLVFGEMRQNDVGEGDLQEHIALLEEETAALRLELEECKEDLKRDEDIFAEKVKELKQCRKQMKDLDAENTSLKLKNEELSSKNRVVSSKMSTSDVFKKMESDLGVVDNDLNISLAVVASEPDISQLMEDLETMAKEKEDLMADKLEVSKTVLSQQEDFQKGQRRLKEELEQLELNTRMKEKSLVDLQRSHSILKELAIKYEDQTAELESENTLLKKKLKEMSAICKRCEDNFDQEQQRRKEIEEKLIDSRTQMKLQHDEFEDALKARNDSEEKSQHNRSLHEEEREVVAITYQKILSRTQRIEAQHQQVLESLSSQLLQYEKKITEQESEVALLIANADDLRLRAKTIPASRELPMDELEVEEYRSRLGDFVDHRLNYLTELKRCFEELSTLKKKRTVFLEERAELESGMNVILSQQKQAEDQLKRNIVDVEARIKHLKSQYGSLRENVNRDKATKKQLDDIKFSIESYEEHKVEFFDRLQEGLLPPDALSKLQDLREDMEVLQTEIDLNNTRIVEEQSRFSKLLKKDDNLDLLAVVQRDESVQQLPENYIEQILLTDIKGFPQQEAVSNSEIIFESALQILVSRLLQAIFALSNDEYKLSMIQQKLEDKQAEYDEVVKAMHKLRSDSLRKQEQQRREADEKVSFLVQQLRTLESVNKRSSEQKTPSSNDHSQHNSNTPGDHLDNLPLFSPSPDSLVRGDGSHTADNSGLRGVWNGGRSNVLGNDNFSYNDNRAKSAGQVVQPFRNNPHSSGSSHHTPQQGSSRSVKIRLTDSMLSEQLELDSSEFDKETLRRWKAEKQRREQLERVNADMATELRTIRQQVQSGDHRKK